MHLCYSKKLRFKRTLHRETELSVAQRRKGQTLSYRGTAVEAWRQKIIQKNLNQHEMQQHCFRRTGAEKSLGIHEDFGDWQEHTSHWRDARLALRSESAANEWELRYRHIFVHLSGCTREKERERGSSEIASPAQYLLTSDRWSSESCGYRASAGRWRLPIQCCWSLAKVPSFQKTGCHAR